MRFRFAAREPVRLPAGQAANVLRGSFGKILFRQDPRAYARYFAPSSSEGPSGLRDVPRPFVFRVAHLEGATFAAGDIFEIGINLFDSRGQGIAVFREAIRTMARERLSAELAGVEGTALVELDFLPIGAGRVRVRFVTPTDLKGAERPDFGILFARIRDRVSTLRTLYGAGRLSIDFKGMGERAQQIRMTRCDLHYVEGERVSRSTGQRHPLGGFTGVVEYEGDLAEFVPYLEAARWTGVGRQTVWGKGEILCETL